MFQNQYPALRELYKLLYGHELSIWSSADLYIVEMFGRIQKDPNIVDTELIKKCIFEMLFECDWMSEPWYSARHNVAVKQALALWPELSAHLDEGKPTSDFYLFLKQQQLGEHYMARYVEEVTKYLKKGSVYG